MTNDNQMNESSSAFSDARRCFADLDQLYEYATAEFCDAVRQTLGDQDTFCVSLSGGSTPKRLYELLSRQDLPWDRVHWFWGDERNVPHDHTESNTRMVREAILDALPAKESNIHAVPVNVDDPAATAIAYEKTLRIHFAGQKFPIWDLALLGMGDDAHTASLFPQTTAIAQAERWFVDNWVEKFDAYRYTLTAPAINSAKRSWFLISGQGKRDAFARVTSNQRQPNLYPAQLIRPTQVLVTSDVLSDN